MTKITATILLILVSLNITFASPAPPSRQHAKDKQPMLTSSPPLPSSHPFHWSDQNKHTFGARQETPRDMNYGWEHSSIGEGDMTHHYAASSSGREFPVRVHQSPPFAQTFQFPQKRRRDALTDFGDQVIKKKRTVYIDWASYFAGRYSILRSLTAAQKHIVLHGSAAEKEQLLAQLSNLRHRARSWTHDVRMVHDRSKLRQFIKDTVGTKSVRRTRRIIASLGDKRRKILDSIKQKEYNRAKWLLKGTDLNQMFNEEDNNVHPPVPDTELQQGEEGKANEQRMFRDRPKNPKDTLLTRFGDEVVKLRGGKHSSWASFVTVRAKVIRSLSQDQKDMISEGKDQEEIRRLTEDLGQSRMRESGYAIHAQLYATTDRQAADGHEGPSTQVGRAGTEGAKEDGTAV